jgi:hypothetical protein
MAQHVEPRRGLTFDDVWAALMEMRESQNEMRESQKELRESQKETDRQMRETDRKLKETGRIVGELGNKFGELSEYLIVPNMVEKFNALGYVFTKAGRNIEFRDSTGKPLTEVDVLLENGDFVMIVEVKSELTVSDVKYHVERMEKLRRYADAHNDKRKLQGAVAGVIIAGQVKAYAFNTGFYVIEQSGDTVKIEAPPGFKPRTWQAGEGVPRP